MLLIKQSALLSAALLSIHLCTSVASNSVLAQSKTAAPDKSETSFVLTQENKGGPTDNEDDEKSFSYGKFKLGTSFRKWKQVHESLGFKNAIRKISKNDDQRAASYKLTQPPLDMWGHSWKPVFLFANDQGVYRLAMIQGNFSKAEAADVLKRMRATLGNPETNPNGSLCWTSKNEKTRTMASTAENGSLQIGIYDRVLFNQWTQAMFKQ